MLTDVPTIDQKTFKTICRLTMRNGGNVLVFGPSGGGKTFIAEQSAAEEGYDLVYINLSVLERTDFQGFPVISEDKSVVSYASPNFMPFVDSSAQDELQSIERFNEAVNGLSKTAEPISNWIKQRTQQLKEKQYAETILNSSKWINNSNDAAVKKQYKTLMKQIEPQLSANNRKKVFCFDEVDKALTETNQTLLELLQFSSINGRKLNIQACILTGNLPDEHAHTNQISHAISKRCRTFKLQIDFQQWRDWAIKNNVHTNVVQFLSQEPTLIYKAATDDVTAYALPSPRTWTDAGEAINAFDADPYLASLSDETADEIRYSLVAGCVGEQAAIKFTNWYKHYRILDPLVNMLIMEGKHPNLSDKSGQEVLIMAISACSKAYSELKSKNKDRIKMVYKNVYSWLETLPPDIQIGAVRLSFGGDFNITIEHSLNEIEEFMKVINGIAAKLNNCNAPKKSKI